MRDIVRDSAFGQLLRLLSRPEALSYPEELSTFKLPSTYNTDSQDETIKSIQEAASEPDSLSNSPKKLCEEVMLSSECTLHPFTSREQGLSRISITVTVDRPGSREVIPVRTKDGLVLVDWYTEDDPDNPQNWSSTKKLWVTGVICCYTFSVYIGSSLYTASQPDIQALFGVSEVASSLGLALYVLAYGIGPMLWSPLSEIPVIGRNSIYVVTYIIFVILCVPTSLVNNFGGLLALRFLLGFFGSPCLATGGASFGDMYAPTKMAYVIAFWAGAATLGPALGPVIAGFAVSAKGWRWSSWELLWLSGPILLVLFISLPETSHDNILLRRAQRLRKLTGRSDLQSQSEINQSKMALQQVAVDALIKPWQINILDPAVLFTTVYTALVYGIFYSFFESFPMVYPPIYGLNLGQTGLPFLVVLVALAICVPAYSAYFYYHAEPIMLSQPGFGPPENRLVPGLFASFLVPVGCFLFGE